MELHLRGIVNLSHGTLNGMIYDREEKCLRIFRSKVIVYSDVAFSEDVIKILPVKEVTYLMEEGRVSKSIMNLFVDDEEIDRRWTYIARFRAGHDYTLRNLNKFLTYNLVTKTLTIYGNMEYDVGARFSMTVKYLVPNKMKCDDMSRSCLISGDLNKIDVILTGNANGTQWEIDFSQLAFVDEPKKMVEPEKMMEPKKMVEQSISPKRRRIVEESDDEDESIVLPKEVKIEDTITIIGSEEVNMDPIRRGKEVSINEESFEEFMERLDVMIARSTMGKYANKTNMLPELDAYL